MKDKKVKSLILYKLYKARNLNDGYVDTLSVIDYKKLNISLENLYRIMEILKKEKKLEGNIKPSVSLISIGDGNYGCKSKFTIPSKDSIKITNLGVEEIENKFSLFMKKHGWQILTIIITIIIAIFTLYPKH